MAEYPKLRLAVLQLSDPIEPHLPQHSPSSSHCCLMCCQEPQFYHEIGIPGDLFKKSLILWLCEYSSLRRIYQKVTVQTEKHKLDKLTNTLWQIRRICKFLFSKIPWFLSQPHDFLWPVEHMGLHPVNVPVLTAYTDGATSFDNLVPLLFTL